MTMRHRRLTNFLVLVALVVPLTATGGGQVLQAEGAGAALSQQGERMNVGAQQPLSAEDPPVPLPRDCDDVTPPGIPSACCILGYVYHHDDPLAGANVAIKSRYGVLATITAGGDGEQPFYSANLSAPPLSVSPGDIVTITASYGGMISTRTWAVQSESQQVDLGLVAGFQAPGCETGFSQPAGASSPFSPGSMVYPGIDIDWIERSPMPIPVSVFGYAVVAGQIYVVGGADATSSNAVQRYTPATDAWEVDTAHGGSLAPLPARRALLHCGAIDGQVHCMGGWDENNSYRSEHFVYDPGSNTWSSGTPVPSAPIGQFAATVGQKIYVFGGWAGTYQDTVLEYAEATGWTYRAPMPTPRNHGTTAVYDGKIYVIAGQGGQPAQQVPLDVVEMYDPAADTWTTGQAPVPDPQHWLGSSGSPVLEGTIYLLGPEETAYAYDPRADTWDTLDPMPGAAYGVAALDGSLYALGADDAFQGVPGAWPMFRHDAQHSGQSPYVGPPDGTVLWTYQTGGAVHSSPAIGQDGAIYVGSDDGNLYALNPDGTLRWVSPTGGGITSSPAIGRDGTVYVGSQDGKLYAFAPGGELKWSHTTAGQVNSSPVIGHDGTVYVGSVDGQLHVLDPDGTEKCSYPTAGVIQGSPAIGFDGVIYAGGGSKLYAIYPDCTLKWASDPPHANVINSSPALSPDGSTVYYGADDGFLYARSTSDGGLKWQSPYTYGGVQASPAIGRDGTVYVGTQYGYLWALDPDDGSAIWELYPTLAAWASPAVDAAGTIYFATDYGTLLARNPDGSEKWTYSGAGDFRSSPAIGRDGTLYIGSTDGQLYAFGTPPVWPMFHHDARHTGRSAYVGPQDDVVQWSYETGAGIYSSPALGGDGTVYVGSHDNKLYAVTGGGAYQWSYPTGGVIYSSPAIGSDGTVYVGSEDHSLYAINPDGTLQWSYPTGGALYSSPSIGHDGTIYVGSLDHKLYALHPDGTLKCEYLADGEIHVSPAIGPDGAIYFGSSNSNRLHAIYPDCKLKWQSDPPHANVIGSSPAVSADGSTVYYGADDGFFYARNTSDGSLKWQSPYTYGGVSSSPALGREGTVYVGTRSGHLWALDPDDGSIVWDTNTTLAAWSSPAVDADGTIYFATDYAGLFARNPDGSEKWTFSGTGHFRSSPAIGQDGSVTIGSSDGNLYAFSTTYAVPAAGFAASPLSGPPPLEVQFTDQSAGATTAWDWVLGDGSVSGARHPAHRYTQAGIYDVFLSVTGPGGSDIEARSNYIQVLGDQPPSWTFMLYLAGDNNLTTWLAMGLHKAERAASTPNVQITALLDGAGIGDTRRYVVRADGNYTPGVDYWEMGELDMADPQTLAGFVNWARDTYPADYYYLAVSDHGAGIRGIAWDDRGTYGHLTLANLDAALSAIAAHDPSKIEIVHYDACLMGMMEVAYSLKDHADYFVASQNLGWSVFAYDLYIAAAGTTSPRELAGQIADEYFNALPDRPRTIAALDLSVLEDVTGATDALIQRLLAGLPAYTDQIHQTWQATQKLDSRYYFVIDNNDEFIDLYHFAQLLVQNVSDAEIQSAAQGVVAALGTPGGSFVVAEHHQSGSYNENFWDLDNTHGLSLYYPPNSGVSGYAGYLSGDLPFTAATQWDEFLQSYFSYAALPPETPTDPGVPPMPAPANIYLPFVGKDR